MRPPVISIILFLFFVGSKAQSQAFLLKWNQERKYDTVCVFDNNTLSITGESVLKLMDSVRLPVSSHDANMLSFTFSDDTYFLLHTVTVLSSITPSYPFFSISVDSLRQGQYKIYSPYPQANIYLQWLQNRWNGEPYDSTLLVKPLLEIRSDCVLYKGDTFNRYNSSGNKEGQWIVYEINNFLRKEASSFYLPFDIAVVAKQSYTNGCREGVWKGYYGDGKICYVCDFKNDKLLSGIFYKWDGGIRYKFLSFRNGMYFFRDFTDKRRRFDMSEEEFASLLRI